jgi:hypothetical protein
MPNSGQCNHGRPTAWSSGSPISSGCSGGDDDGVLLAAVVLLQIVRNGLGIDVINRRTERLIILVTVASQAAALGNGEFIWM